MKLTTRNLKLYAYYTSNQMIFLAQFGIHLKYFSHSPHGLVIVFSLWIIYLFIQIALEFISLPTLFTLKSLSLFLIGRKYTVKFRNQRLWRHLAAAYTIIMSGTLKVMGTWFLRVIMSSSHALCCLPSVKKQKRDFHFFFRSMYNLTIIRFGFCDIQNNQGLGEGYQPQPSALIILDITKTSSKNCL